MPLPTNGPFLLQGHSGPGDTQQSRPKQAMLVRMSVETLEALGNFQGQPKMEFEFGDNPGIFIGETFFPVRPLEESAPHELYLRTPMAKKPGAPLKLYANVTGKFMVERELGESVKNSIRDRTAVAEKQRSERKTILLEAPPVLPPKPTAKSTTAKKRKEPTMFTKRITAADTHRTLSASSTAQTSRVPSPKPTPPQSQSSLTSLRARLIHFLALHRPSTEDAISGVCRQGDTGDRKEVLKLLQEVAEKGPSQLDADEADRDRWVLKTRSWMEVRPWEWPSLTEAEQIRLSRQAKLALRQLKIPENDPAWERLRYRDTGSGAAGSSKSLDTKRVAEKSTVSRPAEDRVRVRTIDQVTAKANNGKAKEKDDASITEPPRPPPRRLPGSGYKAKAGSHTPTPPLVDRLPASLPKKPEVGPPSTKRETPSTTGSSRPTPPASGQGQERKLAVTVTTQQRVVKKTKETNGYAESDRERGRESPAPSATLKRKKREDEDERLSRRDSPIPPVVKKTVERETERDRDRPREREALGTGTSSMLKRKKIAREEEGELSDRERESPKKRKITESNQKRDVKERDLSLPKKPVMRAPSPSPLPSSRPKVKQEPSPLGAAALRSPHLQPRSSLPPGQSPLRARSPMGPPSPMPHSKTVHSSRLASVSSTTSHRSRDEAPHRNGSSKPRRRSPIYTSSSEDEKLPTKTASSKRDERMDHDRKEDRERERERDRKEARSDVRDDRARREREEDRDYRDRERERDSRRERDEKPKKNMRRSRQPLVLPEDEDGLRKMYKIKYPGYMLLYSKHVAARGRVERLREKLLERGGDEVTDSDSDSLSQEDLSNLHEDLVVARGELEQIIQAHEKLVRLGKASGKIDA